MRITKISTLSSWEALPGYTSQSFPAIACSSTGRLFALWRNAPTKQSILSNRLLLSYSDDCGTTWSKPVVPCECADYRGEQGVFRMGGISNYRGRLMMILCRVDTSIPERPFFNEQTMGILDCKIFYSFSSDDGLTWSMPEPAHETAYSWQPNPLTGPALILKDGTLAIQFELNIPFDSHEEWRHRPVLAFASGSPAEPPAFVVEPAADPENHIFYWDQRPMVLKSGRIVNFYWTWDNANNRYLNLTSNFSDDDGRTWSAPHDTGIPGQAGVGVELPDGRLVIPIVDRTKEPKVILRTTTDCGRTFTPEIVQLSNFDKVQTKAQDSTADAWHEMTAFSVGLPASTYMNGKIYAVWYEGATTDKTDIRFAEIIDD